MKAKSSEQEISSANKKATDRLLGNYMENGEAALTEKDFPEDVRAVIESTKAEAKINKTAHQKIEYKDGSALSVSALIHQYGHIVWWVKEA